MNIENFTGRYAVSSRRDSAGRSRWFTQTAGSHPDFAALIEKLGGCVFENGLYRVHSPEASEKWSIAAGEAFPEFGGMIAVFGQTWQGNQFAIKLADTSAVLLLMIGSGEAFEITDTIEQAHEVEFTEYADESLSIELWKQWLSSGGAPPDFNQCVGFVNPLFLGGSNDVGNLELSDTEVYWDITAQLLKQARALPPGTKIARVLKDEGP